MPGIDRGLGLGQTRPFFQTRPRPNRSQIGWVFFGDFIGNYILGNVIYRVKYTHKLFLLKSSEKNTITQDPWILANGRCISNSTKSPNPPVKLVFGNIHIIHFRVWILSRQNMSSKSRSSDFDESWSLYFSDYPLLNWYCFIIFEYWSYPDIVISISKSSLFYDICQLSCQVIGHRPCRLQHLTMWFAPNQTPNITFDTLRRSICILLLILC